MYFRILTGTSSYPRMGGHGSPWLSILSKSNLAPERFQGGGGWEKSYASVEAFQCQRQDPGIPWLRQACTLFCQDLDAVNVSTALHRIAKKSDSEVKDLDTQTG